MPIQNQISQASIQNVDEFINWPIIERLSSSVYVRQQGNSKVVQKQILITQQNQQYVAMEIRLMRDINSPYVVKYLGSRMNTTNRKISILMHYYSNGDLDTYLVRNQSLTFKRKMDMFIDILVGLAQLHSRFIIHRDLKLKNIFVDQSGRCVVGDLGVATVTQNVAYSQLGTWGNQAPQVFSTYCQYDQIVDIWGLGIIAYQLFNPIINNKLAYPFGSPEEFAGNLRFNHNFDLVILPFDSSIPFQLSYLIQKMLSKDPKQRISWLQLYSSEMLFKLSGEDQRLVAMKSVYKCLLDSKQILKNYRAFISRFMKRYYFKLERLLYRRSYRNDESLRKMVEENFKELYLFFYLGMKRVLQKYAYIKEKKIYRLVRQLKQDMQQVQLTKQAIQVIINEWLLTEGQRQITKNKPYLMQSYYEKLEITVQQLLYGQS